MECPKIVLVPLLLALVGKAEARTVRIPLPNLLGPQSVNSLDSNLVFSSGQSVEIPVSSLPHYDMVRFEWSGTIKAGRVVGDGIEREPIEQILRGNFSTGLSAPGHSYGFFPSFSLLPFGSFQASWQLEAPIGEFVDRNCTDCDYPPEMWVVGLGLVPDYFALGNSIPFLEPPDEMEFRLAQQGLILLEGIEADVTSAELVFITIPEPNSAILLLLGIVVAVGCCVRCRPWMSGAAD